MHIIVPWVAQFVALCARTRDQDGGLVIARDVATGAVVWSQWVHLVGCGNDIEDDSRTVFGKRLAIVNGSGRIAEMGSHLRAVP